MSSRPNLSTVKSTIRFTSASFATSARTNAASPPSFLISATTCAPSFSRRPVRTTLAAARANSIAVVLPIPDVPPVTSATLPENFFVFIQFPFAVVEFPKGVPPPPLLQVSPAQPSDVEFSSSNCGSVNCLDRAALRVTAACPAKRRCSNRTDRHYRTRCYSPAERQCSNRTDSSRRRNTAGNPTGRIHHPVRTRSRCQKQRTDCGRSVHAAGPSRGATNLRHDVQQCGPFVRSIPGVQLFQVNALLKGCLDD